MHISRRKKEAEDVVGVPRELSNRSDSFYWRDRCVSRVIADRPMSAATESSSPATCSQSLGAIDLLKIKAHS
jgi:hypothetical protein